jgi:hypothetical protein
LPELIPLPETPDEPADEHDRDHREHADDPDEKRPRGAEPLGVRARIAQIRTATWNLLPDGKNEPDEVFHGTLFPAVAAI